MHLRGNTLLLCLLLAGCQSELSKLPHDYDHPEHARLRTLDEQCPPTVIRVPITEPDGRVFNLALHESTGRNASRRIVFIHGVIADSRLWRYVRGDLASDYSITAPDLLGCWKSDQPDPKSLGPGGHGPAAHARRILQALRQRLRDYPPDTRLTLVGHSLGGAIVIRMYADDALRTEFADVLAQVDSAVLFTPADAWILADVKHLSDVAHMSDFTMWFAKALGILSHRCAAAAYQSVVDPKLAFREETDRFIEILHDAPRRRAGQAMILQAVPNDDGKPNHPAMRKIAAGYVHVKVPVLIAWGECDDVLPQSMGYKLAAQLPDAALRIVPNAMHSVPVEFPAISAKFIREMAETRRTPTPKFESLSLDASVPSSLRALP